MTDTLPVVHAISRSQEFAKGGIAFSIPNLSKVEDPPKVPVLRKQTLPLSGRKLKLDNVRSKTWSCPMSESKSKPKRRASCDDQDSPLSDPDSVLKQLLSSQQSTDWTVQTQLILNLRRLVKYHPELLLPEFGHTLTVLEGFCNSLRSSVQRCGVQVYYDIFRQPKLAKILVNHLPRVLELLCIHATLANKFIREECESVLQCGIEEYSAKNVLMSLLKVRHHNKLVQAQVAVCLSSTISSIPAPFSESVISAVLPAIVSYSQEGLEQSRQAAKAMLVELQEKADDSLLTTAVAALSFQQQQDLFAYAASHDVKLSCAPPEPPPSAKKRMRASNKENASGSELNRGLDPKPAFGTLKKGSLKKPHHNNYYTATSHKGNSGTIHNNNDNDDIYPPSSPDTCSSSSSSSSSPLRLPASPVCATVIHDGNTLTTTTIPNEDLILNTPVVLHKRSSPAPLAYTYDHPQSFAEFPAAVVYSDREEKATPKVRSVLPSARKFTPVVDWETCKNKLNQVSYLLAQIAEIKAVGKQPSPGCLVQVVELQRQVAAWLSTK